MIVPRFDIGLIVFLKAEETKPVWDSSGSLRISVFLSQEKAYETIVLHLNSSSVQTNYCTAAVSTCEIS